MFIFFTLMMILLWFKSLWINFRYDISYICHGIGKDQTSPGHKTACQVIIQYILRQSRDCVIRQEVNPNCCKTQWIKAESQFDVNCTMVVHRGKTTKKFIDI